jgi:hypothetical protein
MHFSASHGQTSGEELIKTILQELRKYNIPLET